MKGSFVLFGLVWFGLVWYDLIWFGLVWQFTWNVCTRYSDGTPSLPLILSLEKVHSCHKLVSA